MIKFMALLMFGGLMFTACSEDEPEVTPKDLEVFPRLVCGTDTIFLVENEMEPTTGKREELVVKFEQGSPVRSAKYVISDLQEVETNKWETASVIAEGDMSINNYGYVSFDEPLYFIHDHRYELAISATDALGTVTEKKFYFWGNTPVVDFEGDYFTALVDDAQYNGKLIYSGDEYKWNDAVTGLTSEVIKADWSAWGMGFGWDHGIAISNYVNPDAASYQEQLSVAKADGNFAVAYDNGSALTFNDSKAHTFVSIDLSPVAYAYNSMLKACGEGYAFDVILTFALENGETAEKVVNIAKDNLVQSGFETVKLGYKATSMTITFDGSDKGTYGLNTPKYIAIDNVVIGD